MLTVPISHALPDESKIETEEPLLNGSSRTEEAPTTNGVTSDDDVKMENGENDTKPPTSPPAKPKEEEQSSNVIKTEAELAETKVEAPEQPEEEVTSDKAAAEAAPKDTPEHASNPAPLEDVDMADPVTGGESAKITEEKPSEDAPVKAASVEEPTTRAQSPAKEPVQDAEMTDKPSDDLPKLEMSNGTGEAAPADDAAALPASEADLQPASLSQLAIETTEGEAASAQTPADVPMEDAPAPPAPDSSSSIKVAREREDDAVEQPAPKRARTEPREDESTVTAAAQPGHVPDEGLAKLTKWNDSEHNAKEITPYQRREMRKVIGRVKKTKHGAHFRDSVQKLWPALWDSYVARIDKPMDLAEIDRNLRDPNNAYATFGSFREDLALIHENTLAFNGPTHLVTLSSLGAIRAVWEDVISIPEEEPARPKPVPKQKPIREPRAVATVDSTVRRQSTGPVSSPALDGPEVKTSNQSSDLRRASSATEGDRPKRTVRAPKPKDIDYTTKPSRKKLKPELQFCEEVLSELMHPKNKYMNTWFLDPVDAEGLNVPQYYAIIKKPMDLGKVSRMLANGEISNIKEFDKNVKLIFTNCYTFNGTPDQGNAVSMTAKQLEDFYLSQMRHKDAWLAKHAKAHAPTNASNASDDEDDEDEDEFESEDLAASAAAHAKEVRELEAKLREESGKLNDLFAADSPNQALITVQQGILKMVQEALLKAKQTFGEYRQKHEKPNKKASKPSKSKSSGGSTNRKSAGGASHPKKAGTKKATKKSLTAADKDQIANAINDLEYPHLDRAIDIIKRDTGQAVS